jgi:predicted transcriptional regulator
MALGNQTERKLNMIDILLSIRRPFSGLILSGEKTWELRKTKPFLRRCGPATLWLYESGKDGERAIIGKCQLNYLIRMISYIPDELIKDACITKERGRSYLPCYAWHIYDPVRLPLAVPLSDIGLTRPPQSWKYLTDEQAAILERRLA